MVVNRRIALATSMTTFISLKPNCLGNKSSELCCLWSSELSGIYKFFGAKNQSFNFLVTLWHIYLPRYRIWIHLFWFLKSLHKYAIILKDNFSHHIRLIIPHDLLDKYSMKLIWITERIQATVFHRKKLAPKKFKFRKNPFHTEFHMRNRMSKINSGFIVCYIRVDFSV